MSESTQSNEVAINTEQMLMAQALTIFQNLVDGILVKHGHEPVISKLNGEELYKAFRVFAKLDPDGDPLDALRPLHFVSGTIFPSFNKGKYCYLRVPFEAAQQMAKIFKPIIELEKGEKVLKPLKKAQR